MGLMGGGGNPFALEKRKYPIWIVFPMRIVSSDTLIIPRGWKIKSLPEKFNFENPYIKVVYNVRKIKNRMIIDRSEMTFKKTLIPVSEYKKIKDIMEKIDKLSKQEIILKRQR